jgi:hypothetical protein
LRIGSDGRPRPQVIGAITQQRPLYVPGASKAQPFYGGATLVVDLKTPELKYAIYKRIDSQDREKRTMAFLEKGLSNPLTKLLLEEGGNRFAALHGLADIED